MKSWFFALIFILKRVSYLIVGLFNSFLVDFLIQNEEGLKF